MAVKLVLVVPCFNEEAGLPSTIEKLLSVLSHAVKHHDVDGKSRICLIDDGSIDQTWNIIERYNLENKHVTGIKLSRNFGHQNALMAGMTAMTEDFDCIITLDADLQDDPEVIHQMLDEYRSGKEIVYGVRNNRKQDSFFKKQTAVFFYRLMIFFGIPVIHNHADFRLIGRTALKELKHFGEVNLFLRGMVPLLGYPSSVVYYTRFKREYGNSKYSFLKMISFAWQGITSFSSFPLTLILYVSILSFFLAIVLISWVVYIFYTGQSVPGWASILVPVLFFSGLQGIFLGVIGQYIGKIYLEVKNRPRYIVEKSLH